MEPKEVLQQIAITLAKIDEKLEKIVNAQSLLLRTLKPQYEEPKKSLLDIDTLLKLKDHLRETAKAVGELGIATADQIASVTGRTRAAESDYLNQLARRGFLYKERRGRLVYFKVPKP